MHADARPASVAEYIAQYPAEIQQILTRLRALVYAVAPGASEKISYGMAGFFLGGGGLAWFGVYKRHIGFYPRTAGMQALEGFSEYKGTKGSVHFPLGQPMPYDLIRRMLELRVAEVAGK